MPVSMENPTLSFDIGRHVCHTFSSRNLQIKLNHIRDQNNKNTVINKKNTHRALHNQTC